MRTMFCSVLAVLGHVVFVRAAGDVRPLTEQSFDGVLAAHERLLVEFFAPWCAHCIELEPEYRSAAALAAAEGLAVVLASVDVSVQPQLSKRFNVKSFPVMHYFVGGHLRATVPDATRTAETLKDWLRRREITPVEELDEEGAVSFLSDLVDVGFHVLARTKRNSVRSKAFFSAVKDELLDVENTSFAVVWLPKSADAKADASLTLVRQGFAAEERTLTFAGAWSQQSLTQWVKNGMYATLGSGFDAEKFGPAAMGALDFDAAVVAVLGTPDGDEGLCNVKGFSAEALLPAAKEYSPRWRFTVAEERLLSSQDLMLLGAKPGARQLSLLKDGKRFILELNESSCDAASVARFLKDVDRGSAKPHYKSMVVPEGMELVDGILALSGDTFESQVFNSSRDVFVDFYAPGCIHCKKLEPQWRALAQEVATRGWGQRAVFVATMDVSANECQEQVEGYPKLVLYPAVAAGKKMRQKQVYTGQRQVDALLDFLAENARNLEGGDEGEGSTSKRGSRRVQRSDL